MVVCVTTCNPAQEGEPDQIMGPSRDLTTNRDSKSGEISYGGKSVTKNRTLLTLKI